MENGSTIPNMVMYGVPIWIISVLTAQVATGCGPMSMGGCGLRIMTGDGPHSTMGAGSMTTRMAGFGFPVMSGPRLG